MTINILFVCATLEPGKCGVADYILSLASILCSKGYSCACLAIHDKYYTSSLPGIANSGIEGTLSVFRISSGCPWFSKAKLINEYLETLNPDCISLQYVPYAYDPKGLPFAFSLFHCHLQSLIRYGDLFSLVLLTVNGILSLYLDKSRSLAATTILSIAILSRLAG